MSASHLHLQVLALMHGERENVTGLFTEYARELGGNLVIGVRN